MNTAVAFHGGVPFLFGKKRNQKKTMSQNSRYETGEREADYKTLIRLADYFDVSIDYLLERTDDPTFHKE